MINLQLIAKAASDMIAADGGDAFRPGTARPNSTRFTFCRAAQIRLVAEYLQQYPYTVSACVENGVWAEFDESMGLVLRMPCATASRRRREILAAAEKLRETGHTTMIDVSAFRK